MKKGYISNIEKKTLENAFFRKVLYTGKYVQLVLMSLQSGEDIGLEIHETHDQFIRVESGKGMVFIDGKETEVSDGSAIIIPAGSEHNLTNTGDSELKLYTLYGPPEHADQVVHKTKEEAVTRHEQGFDHFDGIMSE